MKVIQIELPNKLAAEIEACVKTGRFGSEAEVIRAALLDFVRRNRLDLLEGFMRQDIQWALSQKGQAARGRRGHPQGEAVMLGALKRIKRCILGGQVRFTFKAELEMLADRLSRTDVLESIMNAQGISKILRSRGTAARPSGERLYVIHGFTFDNILV